MARSRNIKPGFFKSEQVADCSDGARLLFIGLWTLADYRGVLGCRPRTIKAEVFPHDKKRDMETLISELENSQLISVFELEGKRFIHILAFTTHQNPTKKEVLAGSPHPDPPQIDPGTIPVRSRIDPGMVPVVLIPDSLNPDPDSLQPQGAKKRASSVSGENEYTDTFRLVWSHWKGHGWSGRRKAEASNRFEALCKKDRKTKWVDVFIGAFEAQAAGLILQKRIEGWAPRQPDLCVWIEDKRGGVGERWKDEPYTAPKITRKIVDEADWDEWRREQNPKPSESAPDEAWAKYFSMDVDEYREAKRETAKEARK